MNNLATVMYRNPMEEWLWESGVMSWGAAILLGLFALAVLFRFALYLACKWQNWRKK